MEIYKDQHEVRSLSDDYCHDHRDRHSEQSVCGFNKDHDKVRRISYSTRFFAHCKDFLGMCKLFAQNDVAGLAECTSSGAVSADNRKGAVTLAECTSYGAVSADNRKGAVTLAECTSYGALSADNRKCAFTLAEVLITLGIIGIVAAMTLPTLIQKQQRKALETAFKKSYANLYNAFNLVIADGYPVYVVNPTEARPDGDVDANSVFAQEVYAKYKKIKLISSKEKRNYTSNAKNYTKAATMSSPRCSQYMGASSAFIMPDGSALAIMQNCGGLWFTIDTNGIYKGPNALGHDIFIFVAWKNTEKLLPATSESEVICESDGTHCSYNNTEETANKCSLTSLSNINGATCAVYALFNNCPSDNSKTYWECLP